MSTICASVPAAERSRGRTGYASTVLKVWPRVADALLDTMLTSLLSRNEENMAPGLSFKQSILRAQVDRRLDSLSNLYQRPVYYNLGSDQAYQLAFALLSQCFVSSCTNMKIRIEEWIVEKDTPSINAKKKNYDYMKYYVPK